MIYDCVTAYIRNNPKEYQTVVKDVIIKRNNLHDKKYGLVKDKDSAKNFDMRIQFSIPDKLFDAIEILLEAHTQERFLDVDGESKWFSIQFPQFFIPEKL